MPIRDSSLVLRSGTGNLTASAVGVAVEFFGTPFNGMAVQVNVPSKAGTSPSLTVYVHTSTSTACDTTKKLVAQSPTITATGEYIIPFVDPDARSVICKFDTAGSSPSFGAVTAYLVKNVGKGWDRSVSFQ